MKQGSPKRLDTSKIEMVTRARVGAGKGSRDQVIVRDERNILGLIRGRSAAQQRLQKKILAMRSS